MPAKAGIQSIDTSLGPGFRRGDSATADKRMLLAIRHLALG
jgi:hypothetical protein